MILGLTILPNSPIALITLCFLVAYAIFESFNINDIIIYFVSSFWLVVNYKDESSVFYIARIV